MLMSLRHSRWSFNWQKRNKKKVKLNYHIIIDIDEESILLKFVGLSI